MSCEDAGLRILEAKSDAKKGDYKPVDEIRIIHQSQNTTESNRNHLHVHGKEGDGDLQCRSYGKVLVLAMAPLMVETIHDSSQSVDRRGKN